MTKSPSTSRLRHWARRYAMQALYQNQFVTDDPTVVYDTFVKTHAVKECDWEYFRSLLLGVLTNQDEIDGLFEPLLDRPLAELNPVELAVLRMSTYELQHQFDVPFKVVINEALELDKKFGSTDGHKYLNGVLDKLSMTLRSLERQGGAPEETDD